jgi:CBS domain containing-hemolysin-like protein
LEIVVWILLLLVACVSSATQAVGASVRDLQPPVFAKSARVRYLRLWAAAAGSLAVAGTATVAVIAIFRAGGDLWIGALGAGLSSFIALSVQEITRRAARTRMDRLARNLPSESEVREETLEQMVDAGEKAGLIEADAHEMISGIIRLDRTLAREIMVPRIDMIAIEVETPLRDALDVVIAGAHSRVPVYEESVDHVIGLLYAKDLLRTLREGKVDVPLRSLLRPAHFVPESKRLDELLQELQKSKVHMAIVVDEYGGTAGIVTIEDVLEEIVGEIQDEYDTGEESLIERISENEGVFNARVNIAEVNEMLSLNLPNESDTLGGLVYQRLEKMPKVGDQVRVDDVTISVLSVIGRRIKKVRVAKIESVASRQMSDVSGQTIEVRSEETR